MKLAQYRLIAPKVNAALGEALKPFGLKVGKIGATIEEHMGEVRIRLVAVDTQMKDASGKETSPDAERFKQFAEMLGMKKEWLGESFVAGAKTYTIVGLNGGRSMKVVVTRQGDDKRYVYPNDGVIAFMTAKSLKAAG